MERYTMFLDWKNRYCQNDYTTQGNLQIQRDPYQITNGIFHRTRTKNLKICMETKKTLNNHLEGWDREGGREMQEGGDMGIYVYI